MSDQGFQKPRDANSMTPEFLPREDIMPNASNNFSSMITLSNSNIKLTNGALSVVNDSAPLETNFLDEIQEISDFRDSEKSDHQQIQEEKNPHRKVGRRKKCEDIEQLLKILNNPLVVDLSPPKTGEEKKKLKFRADKKEDSPVNEKFDPNRPKRNKTITNRFSEENFSLDLKKRKPRLLNNEIGLDDMSKLNNDFCESCRGTGIFVCCETCPKAFHFTCAEPPINPEKLPEGSWQCCECLTRKNPPKDSTSLFGPLITKLNSENPVSFSLPEFIQNYYEDVSAQPESGDYKEGFKKNPLRRKFVNDVLCHVCHLSSIRSPLLCCDYCPLSFHLDCLDLPPPLPPHPLYKWKCPCHIDHLLPKKRKRRNPNSEFEEELNMVFESEGVNIVVESGGKFHELPSESIRITFFDKMMRHLREKEESKKQEQQEKKRAASILNYLSTPLPVIPVKDNQMYQLQPTDPVQQEQFVANLAMFHTEMKEFLNKNEISNNLNQQSNSNPVEKIEISIEESNLLDQAKDFVLHLSTDELQELKKGNTLGEKKLPRVESQFLQFLAWQLLPDS